MQSCVGAKTCRCNNNKHALRQGPRNARRARLWRHLCNRQITMTALLTQCIEKILNWSLVNILFMSVVLKLSWFLAPFQRLSTLVAPCSSIKILIFVLGFAISRQSYLIKASARGPGEALRGPQGGDRAPVENPWFNWI